MKDFTPEVDTICEREIIDVNKNQHGNGLIEFLIESQLCIVNGRINEGENGFTNTRRGHSVVDYIITGQDTLDRVQSFDVISLYDMVKEHHLYNLLGTSSKIPDHSMLISRISLLGDACNISASQGNTETIYKENGNFKDLDLKLIEKNQTLYFKVDNSSFRNIKLIDKYSEIELVDDFYKPRVYEKVADVLSNKETAVKTKSILFKDAFKYATRKVNKVNYGGKMLYFKLHWGYLI